MGRPMKPAGGAGAMRKPAPVTTGRNRPTMGTSAFKLVDDGNHNDFRAGFLVARPAGIGASDILGPGGHRKGVEHGGPQFGITASRGAQAETYSGTLASGRLFKPAMRTPGSEFSAGRARL